MPNPPSEHQKYSGTLQKFARHLEEEFPDRLE